MHHSKRPSYKIQNAGPLKALLLLATWNTLWFANPAMSRAMNSAINSAINSAVAAPWTDSAPVQASRWSETAIAAHLGFHRHVGADPAAEALLATRPELAALVHSRAGQPGYSAQLRWVHDDQSFWVSVAPDAPAQLDATAQVDATAQLDAPIKASPLAHQMSGQIAAQPRSRLQVFALPAATQDGNGLALRFEEANIEPVIAIYSSGQVYSPLVVVSQRGPNDYVVRGYHLFEGRIINSLLATSVTFPDVILNTKRLVGGMRIRVSVMDGAQLRSQLYAFEKAEATWRDFYDPTPFNDRFSPGDDDRTSF